jgi:CRP-like cAMP-binding protein
MERQRSGAPSTPSRVSSNASSKDRSPSASPQRPDARRRPSAGASPDLSLDAAVVDAERNRIIRLLPDEERAWLLANAERVSATLGEVLAEAGDPLDHVYFPLNCIASLVNPTDEGLVEVGTVGNEGFVGLDVFLGADAQPTRVIWQLAGDALRMPASTFVDGIGDRPALERLLRRYAYAFLVQVGQSASCNRMHALEQRCARWLLMTHDRAQADNFRLTQQFLGYMLGVHRPAVTLAAQALQRDGLISYSRGSLTVRDRVGLEARACECYAVVREHFVRLLGVDA